MSLNLILTLLKDGRIEDIKLTKEAIPEVYNLEIIMTDETYTYFIVSRFQKIERNIEYIIIITMMTIGD